MLAVRRVLSLNKLLPNIRTLSNQRPLVDLTVDNDGVAIMTLQRPPVNSLNLDMLKEMSKALDDVAKNKIRAMILTSATPKVFCAGGDIMEMYTPDVKRVKEFFVFFVFDLLNQSSRQFVVSGGPIVQLASYSGTPSSSPVNTPIRKIDSRYFRGQKTWTISLISRNQVKKCVIT